MKANVIRLRRRAAEDPNAPKRTAGLALNARAYATRIGVPYGTVKRWIHEGMPSRLYGRARIVDTLAADAWVRAQKEESCSFSRASVLYAARRVSDGAIKIGFTSDPERRASELRKPNRGGCEWLGTWPGSRGDMIELHRRFLDFTLPGGWLRGLPVVEFVVEKTGERNARKSK